MDRGQVEAKIQALQTEIAAAIEILDDEYTRITVLIDERNALQKRIKRSDRMREVWRRRRGQ